MQIVFKDWTEEQKEEFWEEWCSIGAYVDDAESSEPWGMPWLFEDSIEVSDSCETMRDIAEDYWEQVRDQIEMLLEAGEQQEWD